MAKAQRVEPERGRSEPEGRAETGQCLGDSRLRGGPAAAPRAGTRVKLPLGLRGRSLPRSASVAASAPTPGWAMSQCAEAAAVAATVPGVGMGKSGLRPPMVPRQASFFPPPVPNPFVQQTRMGAARRLQVRAWARERRRNQGRGVGLTVEADAGEGSGTERGGRSRGGAWI